MSRPTSARTKDRWLKLARAYGMRNQNTSLMSSFKKPAFYNAKSFSHLAKFSHTKPHSSFKLNDDSATRFSQATLQNEPSIKIMANRKPKKLTIAMDDYIPQEQILADSARSYSQKDSMLTLASSHEAVPKRVPLRQHPYRRRQKPEIPNFSSLAYGSSVDNPQFYQMQRIKAIKQAANHKALFKNEQQRPAFYVS